MELRDIKPSLTNIISTMANLTNLEYAIFDTNSHLVSSTNIYLQRKGSNVHSASIEEVLSQGNIIVNKPGHMKSCIGCRFVNNCPSTIEILSCIKINSVPIGVVSLTSFSQEGHTMIEDNISNYMDILEYISNLVSMFASNEASKKDMQMLHIAMDEITKDVEKNFIVMDTNGLLIYWDKGIQELFSYCNLYTQSIHQIFSDDITNWVFSARKPIKKFISYNAFKGLVNVNPLKVEDEIVGYSLKLEEEKHNNHSIKLNYIDAIISKNEELDIIKRKILKISNSSSSVLITGETGTGKEMVAKAIHFTSNRKEKPFVPINCANIPESLFESELFGYDEGAFTGAKKGGKLGIFEIANGGTIFLDEIGDLPLHLQAKLLRVLQENTIQRLGSITPIPVDIRIISATNQDLEFMITDNKFREDLFYRLNVIPIGLPQLNKRFEDIELLANHFIHKYNTILKKSITSISDEVLDIFKSYTWPGNIRELENTIEYAINMEESKIIQLCNLPARINKDKDIDTNPNMKKVVSDREYHLIVNALDKNGWDVKGKEKSAKELGLSLRTLYRKLKETSRCN